MQVVPVDNRRRGARAARRALCAVGGVAGDAFFGRHSLVDELEAVELRGDLNGGVSVRGVTVEGLDIVTPAGECLGSDVNLTISGVSVIPNVNEYYFNRRLITVSPVSPCRRRIGFWSPARTRVARLRSSASLEVSGLRTPHPKARLN